MKSGVQQLREGNYHDVETVSNRSVYDDVITVFMTSSLVFMTSSIFLTMTSLFLMTSSLSLMTSLFS